MSTPVPSIRQLICTAAALLACFGLAEASAQATPRSDGAKIANAMAAAPAAISKNASIVEMTEGGGMKTLRKGSNEWTCVADDPATAGNDPMCLDPNALEWLHAYMSKAEPPGKIGFIYMLKGGWDFSNTEPYATKPADNKPTITGPHVMIVGPGVKGMPGYERTGDAVNTALPYVMWKNTPYEHLMIPVR